MPKSESKLTPLQMVVDNRDNNSNHDVSLVVHGGGMAGVVGAGILNVMQEEGLFPEFSDYSGISAGALALSAALSGKLGEMTNIIVDELPRSGFIRLPNILRGAPIMNSSLVEQILTETLGSIPDFGTKDFQVGVTSLPSLSPVAINMNKQDDPSFWLRASAHMPFATGDPLVDKSGKQWSDGGLAFASTSDMAKHAQVVNIHSLPPTRWSYPPESYLKLMSAWLSVHGVSDSLAKMRNISGTQMTVANNVWDGFVRGHQEIAPMHSTELPDVLCMDPVRLRAGYLAGQAACTNALNGVFAKAKPCTESTNRGRAIQAIVLTAARLSI